MTRIKSFRVSSLWVKLVPFVTVPIYIGWKSGAVGKPRYNRVKPRHWYMILASPYVVHALACRAYL
jgi:hypothetical protein